MDKVITIKVCDLCDALNKGRSGKAAYKCPICGRDICRNHAETTELIDVICIDCRKAIDSLDVKNRDIIKNAIVEILKPVVVVKKL